MLRVENLGVWFGGREVHIHAVKEVSFQVTTGSSFGLIGESGSGKSTILRAIVGLIRNLSGEIEIDGSQLCVARSKDFYKAVQMVFQDPYGSLHPRQTVDRVLAETLHLHEFTDSEKRIQKLLDDVGLGQEFRFRYPHQLSGGQRQRVSIARALAPEPRLLLLDEPTSALDVSVQAEILNLLSDLRESRGLTYLLVSHDIPVVAHMCDVVGFMKHGKLVETVSTAELRRGNMLHDYSRDLLLASGYEYKSQPGPLSEFNQQ
ncbi:ABC transporter ATP-binding protein [Labrenzia sp. DG1229]|uniref:ABC transporter ATP-binding protein n=1 Tax=Labrenzia sp. DG1229 TaxID=681847 RepID=UPI00048B7A34|nr:ABC transporter ATP-binding protein [Labrenzia sp. DG1229]